MTAALIFAASIFVPTEVQAAEDFSISWADEDPDPISGYTVVSASDLSNQTTWETSDAVVVTGEVTVPNRVTFAGSELLLVLRDGSKITFQKGIELSDGTVFEVLPEFTQRNGQLIIKGDSGNAGISGDGTFQIYGGNVSVTGGSGAAGISLGQNFITVEDGTLSATGGTGGAGIGGYGLSVKKGSVTATGNGTGWGIATSNSAYENIDISGGSLTATGGASGGGMSGRVVNISGGTVNATGHGSNSAIYASSGNVAISGGTITAKSDAGVACVAASGNVSTSGAFSGLSASAWNASSVTNLSGPTTFYTVTFDTDGGSAVAAQTVQSGYTATKPADPSKSGYTFSGWKLDNADYSFSTPVTDNITLTASWTENAATTYTVTFQSNGGSSVASKTVTAGGTVAKPTDPTKSGYTFAGWRKSGASSNYNFSTPVTENITLVAQWTQNSTGTGTELPNTDSMDARGVYATILILSALCAGGAFLVRRRGYRKS